MDIDRENYDLGLPVIEKAGVAHKIDFREGPALPVLDEMIKDVSLHVNKMKTVANRIKIGMKSQFLCILILFITFYFIIQFYRITKSVSGVFS